MASRRQNSSLEGLAVPFLKKGPEGAENLLWDFSELDYISSAGFRVLLVAQNMLDNPDNMKVLHANDMVQTAFILTGLGELLIDG